MGGNYDPSLLGKSSYLYIPEEQWPESIKQTVRISTTRFMHYINSDFIRHNEIASFKKEWITQALMLIPEELMQNEVGLRKLFKEIMEDYKKSMKVAILNYLLRSPHERKRLNITLIPRPILTSSQRIAREGGFCTYLYPQWHQSYIAAKENLFEKLLVNNIAIASILD